VAEKKKEESVSKVFTPFGVLVGDAGARKAFDAESFYEEVLKPSEKAQYEKFKVDFLKNPKDKVKKVSAGFIPWKKLIVQSKSRNHLILDKLWSSTWALNKEAIPGFIDLIEKLREKYSTVLGDDKLLEYLEAAQHRARELEASGEVDGNKSESKPAVTNSSLNAQKSASDLEYFYNSRNMVTNKPIFSSATEIKVGDRISYHGTSVMSPGMFLGLVAHIDEGIATHGYSSPNTVLTVKKLDEDGCLNDGYSITKIDITQVDSVNGKRYCANPHLPFTSQSVSIMSAKTRDQSRKIQEHMLSFFDNYESLLNEAESAQDSPEGLRRLVEGGSFECYNDDVHQFLNELYGTPPEAQGKYSDDVAWNRYVSLLTIELSNILRNPWGGGKNYIAQGLKRGLSQSITTNAAGIPINTDRWDAEPCTTVDGIPVWIIEDTYSDYSGRHEGYLVDYGDPDDGDFLGKLAFPLDTELWEIEEEVRKGFESHREAISSRKIFSRPNSQYNFAGLAWLQGLCSGKYSVFEFKQGLQEAGYSPSTIQRLINFYMNNRSDDSSSDTSLLNEMASMLASSRMIKSSSPMMPETNDPKMLSRYLSIFDKFKSGGYPDIKSVVKDLNWFGVPVSKAKELVKAWGNSNLTSSFIRSGAEGVDQQAYNNYIQQLVATGVPEDQARQMADQLVNQIKQNQAQFVQNIQQPAQGQNNSSLAASFRRVIKSGLPVNYDDDEELCCEICGSPDGVCICGAEESVDDQIEDFIDGLAPELKGQIQAINKGLMTEDELLEWIREQLSVGYKIDESFAPVILEQAVCTLGGI